MTSVQAVKMVEMHKKRLQKEKDDQAFLTQMGFKK